jgi:hypothetical protein
MEAKKGKEKFKATFFCCFKVNTLSLSTTTATLR